MLRAASRWESNLALQDKGLSQIHWDEEVGDRRHKSRLVIINAVKYIYIPNSFRSGCLTKNDACSRHASCTPASLNTDAKLGRAE